MRRLAAKRVGRVRVAAISLLVSLVPMAVAPQAVSAQTVVIGGGSPSVEVNLEALGIPGGAYGDGTRFGSPPPLFQPGSGDARSRIVNLPRSGALPQRPPAMPGSPPPTAAQSRLVNLPSPPPRAQARAPQPASPAVAAPMPERAAPPDQPTMRPAPGTRTASERTVQDVEPVPGGAPVAVTPEQLAARRAAAASAERAASSAAIPPTPAPAMPRVTDEMPGGEAISSVARREEPAMRAQPVPPPPRTAAAPERTPIEESEPAPEMAPPPTPRQAAPAPAEETRTAAVAPRAPAVPQPAPVAGDRLVRLAYGTGDEALPGDASSALAPVIDQLKSDDNARAQLMAYAEGDAATASAARRLSLFRALKVREYLIEQGIKATRIDVRALGANADEGPADRVDVVMMR